MNDTVDICMDIQRMKRRNLTDEKYAYGHVRKKRKLRMHTFSEEQLAARRPNDENIFFSLFSFLFLSFRSILLAKQEKESARNVHLMDINRYRSSWSVTCVRREVTRIEAIRIIINSVKTSTGMIQHVLDRFLLAVIISIEDEWPVHTLIREFWSI